MDINEAIKRLVRLWIRDIARAEAIVPGGMEGRLHCLNKLAEDLSELGASQWHKALPIDREAVRFYAEELLPAIRRSGTTSAKAYAKLLAQIELLRSQWLVYLFGAVPKLPQMDGISDMDLHKLRARMEAALYSHRPSGARWASIATWYFAFVEDVSLISAGRSAYGPNGSHLLGPWSSGSMRHVRFSAILCEDFFDSASHIDELGSDAVPLELRRRRGEQLREHLSDTPLPIFDLLSSRADWRFQPPLGTWWLVGLAPGEASQELVLFVTDDRGGERLDPTRATLLGISVVPAAWGRRLRDVFSLAHIPDADFGLDPGEPRSPEIPG